MLALAGAAELWLDCLDGTHPDFFAACAQVGPILGLAVFVELVVVMGPYVKADDTKGKPPMTPERAAFRGLMRLNAGLFVISEGAALYAIGAHVTSTFLVVAVLLPWLIQLVLIIQTAYLRAGYHRIGGR